MSLPTVTAPEGTVGRPNRRPWVPTRATVLRLTSAVVGGGLMYLSFPPRPLWWLAPIAFALLTLSLLGRGARAGFGYGVLFGLTWMVPLLAWMDTLLGPRFGPWPWLAVSAGSAALIGAAGAGMAVVGTAPGGPVWMAGIFVTDEAIRERFPFDGFPWGRLAFGQTSGALLSLASVGGAALLTFAVASTGAGLALLVHRVWHRSGGRMLIGPAAALVLPIAAGLAAWPTVHTTADAGTVRAGVVQGSAPDSGLALLTSGDVLWRNHVEQAERFALDIAAGRVAKPDLVILPETVTGLRPGANQRIAAISGLLGVPAAVGARVEPDIGKDRNAVIGWDPVSGETGEYTKQYLVPFGEYVPLRPIAHWFTPFVDKESDLEAGTGSTPIRLGPATVGFAICYEVAFDGPLRGAVRQGAQLLAVPTNNEWFGRSQGSDQQLGMVQERAVEHGRAVVVSATTGVSAIVAPDGTITARTGLFTATDLVGTVPLRASMTLADTLGAWSEWTLVFVGLAGLAFGIRHKLVERGRHRDVVTGHGARTH